MTMKGSLIKYMLTAIVAVVISGHAFGQNIASFRAALAQPDSLGTVVSVSEYGKAADAIRMYDQSPKAKEISGYRIRIFFDNGQNARSEAIATQERFKKEFPGIPTFLAYENPSYIVTVGNCITMDEALLLWNEVRRSFSTAFLWRGQIPIEELLRREEIPADSTEMQTDSLSNTVPGLMPLGIEDGSNISEQTTTNTQPNNI